MALSLLASTLYSAGVFADGYYFANFSEENGLLRVCLSDEAKVVVGNVYGRKGFPDGAFIKTSDIAELGDNYITTISGSRYELGSYHMDYEELLKAAENKDKVISDWRLTKELLMNRIPDINEDFDECIRTFVEILKGNELHEGIMIIGETLNGEIVSGEIISQQGNYVTILVSDNYNIKLNEEQFFVIWENYPRGLIIEASITGSYCGISFNSFEKSFGDSCRPKLFEKTA